MKKKSKKWETAKNMPPLRHSIPEQEFDITKSEVVQWLVGRPEIMQKVFNSVINCEIVYNPETGTWQGVDYAG